MDNNTNVSRETTKKYELISIDDNGNEIRLYNDGSKRNQNGQLIERPDYAPLVITSENAHEYHQMRKRKILESIENGLKDITKTRIAADAIGEIVKKRAEIAMTDNTRVGNEAAKIVLQAVDAYQNKVNETVQTQRQEYAIDDDTMALLQEAIAYRTNVLSGNNDAIDSDNDDEYTK